MGIGASRSSSEGLAWDNFWGLERATSEDPREALVPAEPGPALLPDQDSALCHFKEVGAVPGIERAPSDEGGDAVTGALFDEGTGDAAAGDEV